MWPAANLDMVFQRARENSGDEDGPGRRLVSLLFAPPHADVWRQLKFSEGHLNEQTGDAWDLFFVGVPAVGKAENPNAGRDWSEYFRPRLFREVQEAVEVAHRRALREYDMDNRVTAWTHTGGVDLVSLNAYHGVPDWISLRAARIDESGIDLDLTELSARMRRWQLARIDAELSPGVPVASRIPVFRELSTALYWTSGAVGGGVVGNAAYDLIKQLR
jgi:hypothetical protein